MSEPSKRHAWALLTNHGHVLMSIADQPEIRIREIAARTGITERAAQRIIGDLEAAGFVSHIRVGRRNRYEVDVECKSAHPLERHLDVDSLSERNSEPSQAGGIR
ncbi:MAG: helix-turn-helix domain-containing protein [Acidimicrobiia bacterium]